MKSINLAELKVIQLDILEVIDRFCSENNIKYSLACGSMLGAIRHKGYIPWDDDIDIYMLRKEYERFIQVFPKELNNIKVVSMERNLKWDRAYAQAYDNRTIMDEFCDTPITIGVFVDIYPIDTVPDSNAEWVKYNIVRRVLIRAYELKHISIRWNRSALKNILLIISKILLLPFSSKQMAKVISCFAQRYNGKEYCKSFECVQGMLQKKPFQSSLMTDFIRTQFEDRNFLIMKNYDEYLSNGYGNYMQLPLKKDQVSHHKFKAYWKD